MPSKESITITILTIIDQYVDNSTEVTPTSYFYDLGIDSLDRIEIFASIERQFGIDFSDRYKPHEVETVSQLINIVYTTLHPEAT